MANFGKEGQKRDDNSASNATKRDSNSKLTRTNILLLEFTGQVALQDVARSAKDLFFFGARQAHFYERGLPCATIANYVR